MLDVETVFSCLGHLADDGPVDLSLVIDFCITPGAGMGLQVFMPDQPRDRGPITVDLDLPSHLVWRFHFGHGSKMLARCSCFLPGTPKTQPYLLRTCFKEGRFTTNLGHKSWFPASSMDGMTKGEWRLGFRIGTRCSY